MKGSLQKLTAGFLGKKAFHIFEILVEWKLFSINIFSATYPAPLFQSKVVKTPLTDLSDTTFAQESIDQTFVDNPFPWKYMQDSHFGVSLPITLPACGNDRKGKFALPGNSQYFFCSRFCIFPVTTPQFPVTLPGS